MKRYAVKIYTSQESIDTVEVEAKSLSEAWIKGVRILKSPMVLKIDEVDRYGNVIR